MFQKLRENIWQKVGRRAVGTQDFLPRAHMVNHYGMIDHSNAIGHRYINGLLVNILTKGQGRAIVPMKVTKLQELKKIEKHRHRESM